MEKMQHLQTLYTYVYMTNKQICAIEDKNEFEISQFLGNHIHHSEYFSNQRNHKKVWSVKDKLK